MSNSCRSYIDLISELRALGTMCRLQGDLRRAEQHFRLALSLYDTSFTQSHVDAMICLMELVQVLQQDGRPNEAQQFEHQLELMNARRRRP